MRTLAFAALLLLAAANDPDAELARAELRVFRSADALPAKLRALAGCVNWKSEMVVMYAIENLEEADGLTLDRDLKTLHAPDGLHLHLPFKGYGCPPCPTADAGPAPD